jgi:fatty acyl-CoA reductase
MTNQESSTELSVPAALSGKRILLTGATGFLAKVVLEKLIRTVPDARRRDPADPRRRQRRCARALRAPDRGVLDLRPLRAERGAWLERFFAERVECVTGEVTEPHFGLGREGFLDLAARTGLVINAAASVNFREPLDQALAINTLSLHHLTALARAAGAPLVQVSTCYVNGYRQGDMCEEMVHPPGAPPSARADGHYEVEALAGRCSAR